MPKIYSIKILPDPSIYWNISVGNECHKEAIATLRLKQENRY